jgi:hypothetical protein
LKASRMSRPLSVGLSRECSVKRSGLESVEHLARERHQRADLVAPRRDVLLHRELPPHGLEAARHHHHRLRGAPEQRRDVRAKVLDDDLDLLRDVVGVQLDPAHERFIAALRSTSASSSLLAVVRELEGEE